MDKFIRNEKIIFRNLGDEGLALSTEQGEMTGVNKTAAVLLEAMETPQTIEELHARLKTVFDETGPIQDITVFLEDAVKDSLVRRIQS